MTGYWELKPEDQLSAYECLQLGQKDDLGEDMVDVFDLVTIRFDPERKPTESDRELLTSFIKQGYQSGQFDSGVDY